MKATVFFSPRREVVIKTLLILLLASGNLFADVAFDTVKDEIFSIGYIDVPCGSYTYKLYEGSEDSIGCAIYIYKNGEVIGKWEMMKYYFDAYLASDNCEYFSIYTPGIYKTHKIIKFSGQETASIKDAGDLLWIPNNKIIIRNKNSFKIFDIHGAVLATIEDGFYEYYSPNGKLVVYTRRDGNVVVIDTNGKLVHKEKAYLPYSDYPVKSIYAGVDLLSSISNEGEIYFESKWNEKDNIEISKIKEGKKVLLLSKKRPNKFSEIEIDEKKKEINFYDDRKKTLVHKYVLEK